MSRPIECEAAISDDVLTAAREVIERHLARFTRWAPESRWINQLPEKQRPLIPLLMALLDSAEAVSLAIVDNAFDDSRPVNKDTLKDLSDQAKRIAAVIPSAADCPDALDFSLPSMTGKELV